MHVTKPSSGTQPIGGGTGGLLPVSLATGTDWLWGPGGIDEPIGFVTPANRLRYLIPDADGTPVALLSASGTVRAQYAWEPYGQVVTIDQLVGNNKLRLGLHGLFFDRIDLPPPAASITPQADGLYYVRNRFYSPRLGRFLQRDVNASGLLILSTLAFAGEPLEPAADPFDPQAHYTDGLHLFAFLAADPVNRTDPLGLFAIGGISDLMGSSAVRGSLLALEVGSYAASALDAYSAVLSGVGWRNALIDLVIGAAADYAGGKAFDLALDAATAGLRALKSSLRGSSGLGSAAMRGVRYEQAILARLGLVKNTRRIQHEGVTAIPDAITPDRVFEVKDVKKIYATRQLRAIAGWAEKHGKQPVLIVSQNNEYIADTVRRLGFEILRY